MNPILIVEDEPSMLMGLKDNLEFESYQVDTADDGELGLKKILENQYSLVLLDVMLPNISGFDICKKARAQGVKTPIILLTAKGEEIDKVLGLELGADDYITKPFSLRELLARIRAVLRRTQDISSPKQSEKLHIGRLSIDFNSYVGEVEDKEVKMSHKEVEILHYLWDNRNKTVSRDDLLDKVWGMEYQPTSRTIDNFVLKLRQKIEDDPNHAKIILTVHGVGYKLVNS
ncbi:response regulator transcription factor [Marinifilum caeruleilacunae]|uniref:Response regulator transcription factor n=1 Tax=Marinifilum caeruleilacunae TaxID=2499076 RepID=A0ABX1WVN2_9BACT|nr:response regulator transcription factor [Marinifilum caeruleilacunae]NOU59963.1 response regulator transcription factor [Marinifilum caeruleilacunae]